MSDGEEALKSEETGVARGEESRGFSPAQMVRCEACLRANSPTRMNCLYCGAALPIPEAGIDLRRPVPTWVEEGKPAFNIVLIPRSTATARAGSRLSERAFADAADLLHLETGQLKEIIEANEGLPLVRVASREEAELVERKLGALGLPVRLFSDEDLSLDTPLQRIRKLELTGATIKGRTKDGPIHSFEWADIRLFVTGRLFTKRVEVEERHGRFAAEQEIVDSRELQEDEAVLDVYFAGQREGCRIMAHSFDFSCLEERKSLLVEENFRALVAMLRERAASARYDDSYPRRRRLLGLVWPVGQHTEAGGLRRGRPGRFNTETITLMSNEMQFTRYSRLQRRLLELPRDGSAPEV